jgi:thioredoxin 1
MQSKIFIVITVIFILAAYAFTKPTKSTKVSGNPGIEFRNGTLEEALLQAKKEKKLVFLTIYATWCGPCNKLKAHTFKNDDVTDFFNQNYINIALDGDQADGKKLMQKYGLRSYPSLLIVDANGNKIGQTAGYLTPSELITFGENFLKK